MIKKSRRERTMKIDFNKLKSQFGKRYIVLVAIIFSVIFYLVIFPSLKQKDTDLVEGNLASQTIRANKSMENKEETEEKRKAAENAVVPVYSYDDEIGGKQTNRINELFDLLIKSKNEVEKNYQKTVEQAAEASNQSGPSETDYLNYFNTQLGSLPKDDQTFYSGISDDVYKKLLNLSIAALKSIKGELVAAVGSVMDNHIKLDDLSDYKKNSNTKIKESYLSESEKKIASNLSDYFIVANELIDENKTNELKIGARNTVNPVMIYHGEVIVREGVQVDAKAISKLKLLGMTGKKTSMYPYVALGALILIQMITLIWLVLGEETKEKKFRFFNFYLVLMLISILFMKGLGAFQTESMPFIPLLLPAALIPLVLNLFVNRRAGILFALFQVSFSLFIYYELAGTSNLLLVISSLLFSGVMGSLVNRVKLGDQLGGALIWLVALPVGFLVMLLVYQGVQWSDSRNISGLLSMLIGSVLSYVLAIGLHPYIELLVNDDSMIVLNELSNPNHPLLKKLLEEAPGTYHHSMMVASLSSNAVAAIGGRSSVTRVACYYHDIGKTKYTNFFVENLPPGADNPHNFLLPEDSKEIIFSHVTDGVKMLEAEKMPQMIIDICQQHHGTTLMSYFYSKALERNPDVKEEDFRYPGPKPQTKEAAIVNIADTCEAGVRAMKQPTQDAIAEFVRDIITKRIQDGQLDESTITLGELKIVEKSLINGLSSVFHSRIEYPKFKKEIEGRVN